MKPAAAFSIGLWTGAAVMAAVGLFYVQGSQRTRSGTASVADSKLAADTEQIQLLDQENARLSAEVQRLKETASTLKSNLAVSAAMEPVRRIPFRRESATTETSSTDAARTGWIYQAVAAGDVTALPRLEKVATNNNRRALQAVALLADRDQGAALTRVWRSGSLTVPSLVEATRCLAATMEVNPDADQLLRGLAADPTADLRVLYAAVDGLANPSFPVNFGSDAAIPAPPHFRPDYALRIRLLESLRSSFTDESLRAYVDQAKAEAQSRWAELNPLAP